VVNNTEYGLTGSIYSTDRAKTRPRPPRLSRGNLYFNRKCTGARWAPHIPSAAFT